MFDTHLINVALAGLSVTAGVAILIALAIVGVASTRLRHGSAVTGSPASTSTAAAAPAPAVPERLAA